jgi:hypothetical protein
MGVRFPGVGVPGIVSNSVPASGAETIVTFSTPLNLALDFEQILIIWMVAITAGASVTALITRIRRGVVLTGALLTTVSQTVTAANLVALNGCYADTPGAVAGIQYSVTVSATGATGASAVADCAILVLAL